MTTPLVPAHSSTLFRPIPTNSPWRSLLPPSSTDIHQLHQQQPPLSKSKSISHPGPPNLAQQPLQKSRSVTAINLPPHHHPNDPYQPPEIFRPIPTLVRFAQSPSPTPSTPSASPPRTPTSHAQRHYERQMHNHRRREQLRLRPTVKPPSISSTPLQESPSLSMHHSDMLADLHDISSILTDRIDNRSRVAADYSRRKRTPASPATPSFLRRVFRRMRPTREKTREKQRAAATTAAIKAAVTVESTLDLSSIPSSPIAPAQDVASLSESEDAACWSESELRTHSRGQRDYGSFSKRNDTDIDLIHARLTRPAFLRSSRYAGLRDEVPWRVRARVARRRSMEGRDSDASRSPTDLDDKLRECKSTVVVSAKDGSEFGKRERRARYRLRPVINGEVDRRDADRSDSDFRNGADTLRWKRSWRGSQLANITDDTRLGDKACGSGSGDEDYRPHSEARLRSCEHSYQSSNSSVALSVSSVTRTSHSSSYT